MSAIHSFRWSHLVLKAKNKQLSTSFTINEEGSDSLLSAIIKILNYGYICSAIRYNHYPSAWLTFKHISNHCQICGRVVSNYWCLLNHRSNAPSPQRVCVHLCRTCGVYLHSTLMIEEYRDIYEPVIVENPFTQVTECGLGLRQFHIGLTRSKIIFGCDDFDDIDLDEFACNSLDPEIETFQLVSLLPLQFVRLHFFRKQKRDIMSIVICGEEDRPMFFEFGGHLFKSLFWNTWRERVSTIKLLHPNLLHLTGSSPFSSTDVLADDEICEVLVHAHSDYSLSNYSPSFCACSQ